MKKIVIVGGGYAGFYAAWNLEKTLRPDEAVVLRWRRKVRLDRQAEPDRR